MASAGFGPSDVSVAAGRLSGDDAAMIERTRSVRDLLGAKWSVDVLYLLARGARRHGWLYDHLLGISKKTLTETLRRLERDGLVDRTMYAEIPVRVEYGLTPLGWAATGLLMELSDWADDHFDDVQRARARHAERREGSVRPELHTVPVVA
jgi:DNA-binding HxlR family transcriptional regulator